jgi:hypothetical protein
VAFCIIITIIFINNNNYTHTHFGSTFFRIITNTRELFLLPSSKARVRLRHHQSTSSFQLA